MLSHELTLLPTPVADHSRSMPSEGTDFQSLPNALVALLPTPVAKEPGGTAEQYRARWAKSDGRDSTFLPLAITVQLLPAPVARDSHNAGDPGRTSDRMAERGQPLSEVAVNVLMPTPRATDGTKGGPNQRGSSGDLMLPSAVQALVVCGFDPPCPNPVLDVAVFANPRMPSTPACAGHLAEMVTPHLLPTPTAADSKASGSAGYTTGNDGTTLTDATVRQPDRWGEYGPAIRRWEAVTRPAPEPTKPNAKGNPKLSDEFDEWLMGYPAGWITDVPGVTWNEALKGCGNGVVPQQGAAAVRWLIAMGGAT